MRRLVTAAVLLLLGSSAYAQTTCSATCRACGSTVVGGSGGAPTDAQYVTAAADATLSAERVCTDTTTIDCDAGTAGQMKFNLITPIQVATGCATPNFSFVDDSGAGVCLNAADVARLQIGTTDYVQVDTNQFIYVKGGATVMTVTGYGLTFGSTAGTADWFVLTPQATGAAGRYGELTTADLTANRTFTFPDATGDVAVIASTGFPVRTAAQTWATRTITASTGGVVANGDGGAGNPSVGPDTATTPQFSSGTGDVPATGSVGTFYSETDANSFYTYPSTNTEHWLLSIAAGTAQGDLFYASAADVLSALAKDANSTRYLSNTGASNNPAWAQVNLTNGVTGDLPLANVAQASGASVLLGRGSAGGAGDFQEITLGSGLSMSGTALSSSGSLDITGLTAEPVIQPLDDALPFYDASAAANRKILWHDLMGGVGRDYWVKEDEFLFNDESPTFCNGFGDNGGVGGYNTSFGGRLGVLDGSTGTATNGAGGCVDTLTSIGSPQIVPGLGRIRGKFFVRLEDLSDGTDTYTFVAGLGNSAFAHTATPSDGVFFSYTDSVNSGKWRAVCREDGSATNVDDTGSAVAADTWYRLEFEINADATSVEFFVDGTSIGTCGTNVPDSGDPVGNIHSIIKSAGTTNRKSYLDAIKLVGELATAR